MNAEFPWNAFRIFSALLSLTLPSLAHADDASSLFDEGMRLVDSGKVAAGCDQLAESQRLDPGFGVLFNLADCHERLGKTATAWREFQEAERLARVAGRADRETKAQKRAGALEPSLGRIQVESSVPVTCDGALVPPGSPWALDPGTHTLTAQVPGKRSWTGSVTVRAGALETVRVPELENIEVFPVKQEFARANFPPTHPVGQEPAQKSSLVPPGPVPLVLGGLGLAGLGVGAVLGLVAKSTYDGADCRENVCSQPGLDQRGRARTQAAGSTIAFVLGGVALAGGTTLWLTASPNTKQAQVAWGGAW